MQRRYSEYTIHELQKEISDLTEKAQKAEQMGMVNEFAVYQRKIVMAKSYAMDPRRFKNKETYEIQGAPGEYLKIRYMNGIFAWGKRLDKEGNVLNEEEALPIALLIEE
ncbi:YfhH family protein [Halalkalibacillus halophilus]|uniref:YfhH family protein n=1 Tax=Halalkalibacillus halophilus TaxID=392827 RepID=UPI00041201CC|nr:YfhH family protein [Halalkalibacillus halophilus]